MGTKMMLAQGHEAGEKVVEGRAPLGAGSMVLAALLILNLAWFVPFAISTGVGIVETVIRARSVAGPSGGADAGGLQWMLMNLIGPVILGLGLAYGVYRYHTRNRNLDAATEAAAKEQYNAPELGKLDS